MIDKVWYDWQCRDPSSKKVFGGGSISWQFDANVSIAQYPTGAPPWLDVRNDAHVGAECGKRTNTQQVNSVIPGDGLWKETKVRDVMDTTGGRLCYVYE